MRPFLAHRIVTSWIAALAVLLAALAPALSHAMGSSWVEVCTFEGSKWVQVDAGDDTGAPSASHTFEHCPFCSLHVPTPGVPPASTVLPLVLAPTDEFPLAFLAAPRTLHAWVSAQPRAPPSAS
jgi:hypothetical protein